ncbi:DEAD/DEAH box helicase [Bifidobacterium xylocopae]|uniref:Helicase n=1 Tax=Bifidobacterium xylocopae TaxID=2493119 RepID=A0A366KDN5_9BIFI|nr:DEAD/DEAH box helicase [Bifidobacterium xylocopae]RBP99497.1 helicase [Bifidobacterium xylocopae]
MDWHASVYGARAGRESRYGFDLEDEGLGYGNDDADGKAFGRLEVVPESELKRLGRGAFFRAYEVVQSKRLTGLSCRASGRTLDLSASVENSYEYADDYLVSAQVDLDAASVVASSCTCPAFGRLGAVCKHVIALVMLYNESPELFEQSGETMRPARRETSHRLREFMAQADDERRKRQRQRQLELLKVVGSQGEDGGAPVASGAVHLPIGSVSLRPSLSCQGKDWGLRLRVTVPSRGISYLAKDVDGLLQAVDHALYYSYGRKLAFVHSRDTFDEPSRGLLDILQRGVRIRSSGQEGLIGYYRQHRGSLTEMTLSAEEVGDILDLYVGTGLSVDYAPGGSGNAQARPALVVDGDPDLGLSVEHAPDGDGRGEGYLIRHKLTVDRFIGSHASSFVVVWPTPADGGYEVAPTIHRCSRSFRENSGLIGALCGNEPSADDGEEQGLFLDKADLEAFSRTVLPALSPVMEGDGAESGDGAGNEGDARARDVGPAGPGKASVGPAAARGSGSGPIHALLPPELLGMRRLPCVIEVYLDRDADGVTCDIQARYGDRRFHVFSGIGAHEPVVRDKSAERLAVDAARHYFPEPEGVFARIPEADDKAIYKLLTEGLPVLRSLGEVYSTPAFDGLSLNTHPVVRLGLSIKSGLVEISPIADEIDPEEVPALLESYRRKRRYHRLRSGAFVDLADTDMSRLDDAEADMGLKPGALEDGPITVPAYEAYYWDAQVEEDHKDEEFKRYVRDLKDVDPSRYRLPAGLNGVLRPYQEEGFRWLNAACDKGFGGILADEMGLGKTVQLLAFLASRQEEARRSGPSLIVCPASLVYNWVAECAKFTPDLKVAAVAGGKGERRRVLDRAGECDLLVTSYDLLRRDIEDYKGIKLYCVTLDEAQYIKNHATKAAQAVRRLEARQRFALTGTPIENRLAELWSIFDFLMPGILGSYRHFRERFELPILSGDDRAQDKLQAFVGPFILRRRKADVLKDLPEKIENVITVQLEGEQRRIYAALEQRLRMTLNKQKDVEFKNGKLQVLAQLTRMRQACCDPRLLYSNVGEGVPAAAEAIARTANGPQAFGKPAEVERVAAEELDKAAELARRSPAKVPSAKLDAIEELVESCRDAGRKMLIFSQFTSYLDLIAERLRADGVDYKVITGSTPKRKRLELVDSFNADDTPVFLISLKAGNTGLNLTGACVVVHADPWWNAAAQEQANDRAHRIGQTQDVNVYQIVAKDTIEERILDLQRTKSDLAARFVDAASASGPSISSLTRDDLLSLLG